MNLLPPLGALLLALFVVFLNIKIGSANRTGTNIIVIGLVLFQFFVVYLWAFGWLSSVR